MSKNNLAKVLTILSDLGLEYLIPVLNVLKRVLQIYFLQVNIFIWNDIKVKISLVKLKFKYGQIY